MAYGKEGIQVSARMADNVSMRPTTEGMGRMARSAIVNGVRGFTVEASPESKHATAGRVDGMASASLPGLVCLNVTEPVYAGEDLELPIAATVYLTPAAARELGAELIALGARVDRDDVLGRPEQGDAGDPNGGWA